jgi:hypothetical protein
MCAPVNPMVYQLAEAGNDSIFPSATGKNK